MPSSFSYEVPKSTEEEVGHKLTNSVIPKKYSCSLIMKIQCIRQGLEIVAKPLFLRGNFMTIDSRHLCLLGNRAKHYGSVHPPGGCFLSLFQFLIFIENEN